MEALIARGGQRICVVQIFPTCLLTLRITMQAKRAGKVSDTTSARDSLTQIQVGLRIPPDLYVASSNRKPEI